MPTEQISVRKRTGSLVREDARRPGLEVEGRVGF